MAGASEDAAIPLITVDDAGKLVLHADAVDFVSVILAHVSVASLLHSPGWLPMPN